MDRIRGQQVAFLSFYFSVYWAFVLTHFMPLVPFDTPKNIKKPWFSSVFRVIKRDQWHQIV